MSRRTQRETTRRQLFDVSLSFFRSHGFSETSVDQIIQVAGVSKGTFYVHFPSKDAVLATYANEISHDLLSQMCQWINLPPREAIAKVFQALNAYVDRDRRFIWDVIRVELLGDPWDDGEPSALANLLSPIIIRGQQEGVVQTDLSSDDVVQHLLSNYLIGLTWVLRHNWSLEESMNRVLRMTVDGIWQSAQSSCSTL